MAINNKYGLSVKAGVAVFLVHCLVGLKKLEFLSVFGPRTRKTRFLGLGRTKKASCFGPSVVFLVLYTDRFCRTKKTSKKLVFLVRLHKVKSWDLNERNNCTEQTLCIEAILC